MSKHPTLLLLMPQRMADIFSPAFAGAGVTLVLSEQDPYAPETIDYVLSFRPPRGALKILPNIKAVFSVGAGVDAFLNDADYPRHVPLFRFVDPTLSREMSQYVVMHTLMHHRSQRFFEEAQREHKWRQRMLQRTTEQTRIGVLGLGAIGTVAAERLRDQGFPTAGWSRTRKHVPGIESFAGAGELPRFLARSDILICLLPLTPETRGILNAELFAQLPHGALVINVARGGHLIEADLIAALDREHLSGAVLDVFETEPLPETNPLWTHPKIVVTPHVAAVSDPGPLVRSVIDGIARLERGQMPDHRVDLERGY